MAHSRCCQQPGSSPLIYHTKFLEEEEKQRDPNQSIPAIPGAFGKEGSCDTGQGQSSRMSPGAVADGLKLLLRALAVQELAETGAEGPGHGHPFPQRAWEQLCPCALVPLELWSCSHVSAQQRQSQPGSHSPITTGIIACRIGTFICFEFFPTCPVLQYLPALSDILCSNTNTDFSGNVIYFP